VPERIAGELGAGGEAELLHDVRRVVIRTDFSERPDGSPGRGGEAVTGQQESHEPYRDSPLIPGTLRQEVVIDGRHRLITDEPERVGGEGSAPSPHELFPAALAACVATTLVMYARTKEWDLEDVTVDVDYDHHSTPRIFQVDIRLTGELSDQQLERLERVAAACPLRRSIESGIEFVERIELGREPPHQRDREQAGGLS